MKKKRLMKKSDLQKVEIVHYISKGIFLLRGTNLKKNDMSECSTLYKEYKITYHDGEYDSSKSFINYKTLERRLASLVAEGILEEKKCKGSEKEEHKEYYLNYEKLLDFGKRNPEEQNVIKSMLLDNGDYESYRILRDRHGVEEYYNDEELEILKNAVKNRCVRFKNNAEDIDIINTAIIKHEEIQLIYKGKKKSVFPLCYVINRAGTKCYLFSCVKNKLISPMDVECISLPVSEKDAGGNRQRVMLEKVVMKNLELVKRFWDIGEEPVDVELHILHTPDGQEAMKELYEAGYELWDSFDEPRRSVYSGQIYGASDFEKWVRRHINSCIIVQPESMRNRIIAALEKKKTRYEENFE